jgi:hypothetical protein
MNGGNTYFDVGVRGAQLKLGAASPRMHERVEIGHFGSFVKADDWDERGLFAIDCKNTFVEVVRGRLGSQVGGCR